MRRQHQINKTKIVKQHDQNCTYSKFLKIFHLDTRKCSVIIKLQASNTITFCFKKSCCGAAEWYLQIIITATNAFLISSWCSISFHRLFLSTFTDASKYCGSCIQFDRKFKKTCYKCKRLWIKPGFNTSLSTKVLTILHHTDCESFPAGKIVQYNRAREREFRYQTTTLVCSTANVSETIPLINWAPSSEFVSSSILLWQVLTAHVQPFRGARDLAFCLKVPLESQHVWASSEGSGETARMRRLAWTFAARIGDKYQIRLLRSKLYDYIRGSYCIIEFIK